MIPPLAVVFDLDGTLVDSRGDIVAALNHALQRTGRPALPAQLIVRYVGDGARALIARSVQLPEASADVDELLELFLAYYVKHPIDFTRWMDGAREVLDTLAEMPDMALGICTNKPRASTDAVLAALGIRERFIATFAGGDLPEKKPSPAPLLYVAKLMGLPPACIVMVGDGPQDVESARRAGMRSVVVEGGFCPLERVLAAGPDVLLRSLAELPEILQRWRDATARLPTPNRPGRVTS
jgi:2-phosphoglycolate phosphatase